MLPCWLRALNWLRERSELTGQRRQGWCGQQPEGAKRYSSFASRETWKRLPLDTISYSQRARVLLWWVHPLTSPLAQYAGVSLGSPPPSQVKLVNGNPV